MSSIKGSAPFNLEIKEENISDESISSSIAEKSFNEKRLCASAGVVDVSNLMKCGLCTQSFDDVGLFQLHTVAAHTKIIENAFLATAPHNAEESDANAQNGCAQRVEPLKAHTCEICRINFDDKENHSLHMAEHFLTTDVKYSCYKCAVDFSSYDQYRSHFAHFHTEILYRCGVCLKVFSKRHIYEEHAIVHLKSIHSYGCVACAKSFVDYNAFFEHVSLEHNAADENAQNGRESASTCRFEMNDVLKNETMKSDERSRTPKTTRRVASACFSPTTEKTAARHVFVCAVCGEKFEENAHLQVHTLKHLNAIKNAFTNQPIKANGGASPKNVENRDAINGALHRCVHCPKRFSSLSALQGHSHIHKEARNFMCAKCTLSFSSTGRLAAHQRRVHSQQQHRHSGVRCVPFKCRICDEKFQSADSLKAHSKVHMLRISLAKLPISSA